MSGSDSRAQAFYAVRRVVSVGSDDHTYIVFKTVKKHPNMLRGKTNRLYYRKYTSINLHELLLRKCVDDEFKRHVDRFLDEGEFKELMERYIRNCFKNDKTVVKRLMKLEEFIKEPAKVAKKKKKEKQYPVISNYEKQKDILKAIFKNAISRYDFDEVEVYLFKESFCVLSRDYDTAIFLPYDAGAINIEAIPELEREMYVLKVASRDIEESVEDDIEEGQDSDGRLKNALGIINYMIMVYEMLRR